MLVVVGVVMLGVLLDVLVLVVGACAAVWVAAVVVGGGEPDVLGGPVVVAVRLVFARVVQAGVEVRVAAVPRAVLAGAIVEPHGGVIVGVVLGEGVGAVVVLALSVLVLCVDVVFAVLILVVPAGRVFLVLAVRVGLGGYFAGAQVRVALGFRAGLLGLLGVDGFVQRFCFIFCAGAALGVVLGRVVGFAAQEVLDGAGVGVAVLFGDCVCLQGRVRGFRRLLLVAVVGFFCGCVADLGVRFFLCFLLSFRGGSGVLAFLLRGFNLWLAGALWVVLLVALGGFPPLSACMRVFFCRVVCGFFFISVCPGACCVWGCPALRFPAWFVR
ncbi:Histidinol dehydrogenase [Gemmiger formicilis]|uniref:Histidinol dehydrogenase n=1 Tax=Gemmiger formicilis TaxID=745368 RepID=A0A1T4W6Q5_9FIRM|nr:Histidinol dehydrogenase [Gemmiger formicilis]